MASVRSPRLWSRFHRDCPGAGDCDSETCHTFTDFFTAVDAIGNEESTYWCHLCHRGICFPNVCPDPLHLNWLLNPYLSTMSGNVMEPTENFSITTTIPLYRWTRRRSARFSYLERWCFWLTYDLTGGMSFYARRNYSCVDASLSS